MNLTVAPCPGLRGEVHLPGDKSISHRAALLAALADGESRIENFLVSRVTEAMLQALTALGVRWQLDGTCLTVQGEGLHGLQVPTSPIHCGSSGTTMRLLAGALSAAGIPATLDGSEGLRRRPMRRIVGPLRQMGAMIESSDGGAPLILGASELPLHAIDYCLPVASAQVKSCLLLAGLGAEGEIVLREPGPSRDHTERMLRSLRIEVKSELRGDENSGTQEYITRLTPPRPLALPPLHFNIPGDLSAAAFLIVAALITPGSEIILRQVGLNPTRTGLIDVLRSMEADVDVQPGTEEGDEPSGDLRVRHASLHGVRVGGPLVVRMIDEFPAFAIAATYAQGRTVVSQAEELRHKESDRIAELCAGLRRLGASVEESADGFVIEGNGILPGGSVHACGDHRLAMAYAVAGLATQSPVTVLGAEVIGESFPGFSQALSSLGGHVSTD